MTEAISRKRIDDGLVLSRGRANARRGAKPRRPARNRFLPFALVELARKRARQIWGLALVAAAACLSVAVLTHNAGDPSFNRAVAAPAANWLGRPGAYAADVLLQTMGAASFALIAVLVIWGWKLLLDRPIRPLWLRAALLPLALILVMVVLAAFSTGGSFIGKFGHGGFIGNLVHGALKELFVSAKISTAVLTYGSLLLALLVFIPVLGLSWGEWRAVGGQAARAGAAAGRAAARPFGRSREQPKLVARPARAMPDEIDDDLSAENVQTPSMAPPRRAAPTADSAQERSKAEPAPRKSSGKPGIVAAKTANPALKSAKAKQGKLSFDGDADFVLPPVDLLQAPPKKSAASSIDEAALEQNARYLESVLEDFGVKGRIVQVRPGPVVTLYELEPAPGVKSARVVSLADDIARSMSAVSARVAVIPGRNVIGIELPNGERETVYLRELLASAAFENAGNGLGLILGKDIGGGPVVADLARMPHLLIAGTTGSGKSVGINTMILSLLYRHTPHRCKFIMIDPKMLELSTYDGIPHLLAPVVTDPKKAIVALRWAVREMENRYQLMSKLAVRNIDGFNARVVEAAARGETITRKVQTGIDEMGRPTFEEKPISLEPLPFIVVVVDEMADLMLVAGKDIEAAVQRLAQMARAAGIHVIMATQRPSVDVITGTIKANFPTRISFQVTSKIDSRTILGEQGAEQLLGQGDMLYMAGGGRINRVHGPFVSDREVEKVVNHLKEQGQPAYIEQVTEDDEEAGPLGALGDAAAGEGDELFQKACAIVLQEKKASTSFIQRRLQIGYNRAARLMERMEEEGIVGQANHAGKREILAGGM
ncbi:MAG: DNA translocase FtsK [Alphaproteobacteria bacterium]